MAKPRTIPHTSNPPNGKEMVPRNSGHKDRNESLKQSEEHSFCQEQQEGPGEEAGNHVKTMSALAEAIRAIVEPKVVNPNMLKDPSQRPHRLAFTTHLKFGKQTCTYMAKSSGSAIQSLRLKPRWRLQLQFSSRLLFLFLLMSVSQWYSGLF